MGFLVEVEVKMQYLASKLRQLRLVWQALPFAKMPYIFSGDKIAVSAKIDIYVTSHYACSTSSGVNVCEGRERN